MCLGVSEEVVGKLAVEYMLGVVGRWAGEDRGWEWAEGREELEPLG